MGTKAVSLSLSAISLVLVLLLLMQPVAANAATLTDALIKRLCDRQEKMGSRLSRPLIDPKYCASEPEPESPTLTLTASPSAIQQGATTTLAWNSELATSCVASNGWSGSKSLDGSQVVSPATTTTYGLTCTGDGGSVFKQVTVTVTSSPSAPTVSLSASPTSILNGSSTTLTWNSTNVSSCTASNGWSGAKATSGSQSVSPSTTTTYVLTCSGAGGSAQAQVTVTVTAQPTPSLSFSASTSTIVSGASSTLTWSTSNVSVCIASNGWSGAKNTSGSQIVSPTATTTYTLECGGSLGSTTASVTINVKPPVPTVLLTASPQTVTQGGTTTLTWTSTNATTCEASQGWSGTVATSGSQIVTPSGTTTYHIDCFGPGGVGGDDVVVNFSSTSAPMLTFTASPTNVTPGAGSASSTLSWSSTNATLCTASDGWSGSKSLVGNEVVQPSATTTYSLLCSGPGGSVSKSVTVGFTPAVAGKLLITEVLYDLTNSTTSPQGAESANEWVEIYNGTGSDVNLGSYVIGDASSTDALPNVTLPAGKFAIITSSSTTANFWSIPGDAVVVVLTSNIGQNGLSNAGEVVRLITTASTTVDQVSWGSNTEAFSPSVIDVPENSGSSISRKSKTVDTDTASDWETRSTPNPGL